MQDLDNYHSQMRSIYEREETQHHAGLQQERSEKEVQEKLKMHSIKQERNEER